MPASSDPAPGNHEAPGNHGATGSHEETITLAGDLHARPAGQLSVAAAGFASAIRLSAGGRDADAKSVLAVMQLGASSGQRVTVRAAGPDARAAVGALIAILAAVTPAG